MANQEFAKGVETIKSDFEHIVSELSKHYPNDGFSVEGLNQGNMHIDLFVNGIDFESSAIRFIGCLKPKDKHKSFIMVMWNTSSLFYLYECSPEKIDELYQTIKDGSASIGRFAATVKEECGFASPESIYPDFADLKDLGDNVIRTMFVQYKNSLSSNALSAIM